MNKILTVCIPTYKRSLTLRQCIDSIVMQVEEFGLSDLVDIYVANDASPDNTNEVLSSFEGFNYFHSISRSQNVGMNVNIRLMLEEVSYKSEYQLIITDDDYLQLDGLKKIVGFLHTKKDDISVAKAIWTPRYSYKENGDLYCVVCNPFKRDSLVKPSVFNAGRYMSNGFVLSGLFVCAKQIDFKFWETYSDNAYFPMIFFGDLILNSGAYYWNCNVVHHTVLNKCHWESWGASDLLIEIKKFSDSINTYKIISTRISGRFELLKFYYALFPSIVATVSNFIASDNLKADEEVLIVAMKEQKATGAFKIDYPLKELVWLSLFVNSVVWAVKISLFHLMLLVIRNGHLRKKYQARKAVYLTFFCALPKMIKALR